MPRNDGMKQGGGARPQLLGLPLDHSPIPRGVTASLFSCQKWGFGASLLHLPSPPWPQAGGRGVLCLGTTPKAAVFSLVPIQWLHPLTSASWCIWMPLWAA